MPAIFVRIFGLLLVLLSGFAAPPAFAGGVTAQSGAGPSACAAWPRWEAFKDKFISVDGRVIDLSSSDKRTVSEGQAYGLFFALVANDRREFEKILDLTQNILAQGDLTKHLLAWLWGKRSDATWGVIDSNSASDADLWFAYTLLQAGRVWHDRRFTALGALLARNILSQEVVRVPGLGWSILPGQTGFRSSDDVWRFNPSYVPLQVLRGLDVERRDHAKWRRVIESSRRLLLETAPHGFSPDWAHYHADKRKPRFEPDAATHAEGSYNAIRVYLWAGMLANNDPDTAGLLAAFRPMADYVERHGAPPETIDTSTGKPGPNAGNAGFSAALVPFLQALGKPALAQGQAARVAQLEAEAPSGYYSQVLSLFGLGWHEGRFRFRADGSLWLAWDPSCTKLLR